MKAKELKVYATSSKEFMNVSDLDLQRRSKSNYDENFKISKLTEYIGLNWSKDKELTELLTRKGYEQSDFVTIEKGKIVRVNYDFVLSHMKHSAKVQYVTVPDIDIETGLQKLNDKSEGLMKRIVKTLPVMVPVIDTEGAAILNEDSTPKMVQKIDSEGNPEFYEIARVFYTINILLTELRKCEVTLTETRVILTLDQKASLAAK